MKKVNNFVRTTLIGGFGIVLPVLVLFIVFNGLFKFIANSIRPITNIIGLGSNIKGVVADILSIIIIISICFLIGVIVKTRVGRFAHNKLEKRILNKIPGYGLIKDTIKYFSGSEGKPFTSVALIKPFGKEDMLTGFITDSHSDGSHTVFVPQAASPWQGDMYHVQKENVFLLDVSVGDAMKSVIAMGAGSSKLIEKYLEEQKTATIKS